MKKNLKHRFRKEESEMIYDLGHILKPSSVLSSENEEVVKALECVSLFYGSGKTCQIVLRDFTGDNWVEETNIGKLLDPNKL